MAAASVENRRFSHFEPHHGGPFNHYHNNDIITIPAQADYISSSSEEEDNNSDKNKEYLLAIKKANSELDSWAEKYPGRVNVWYVITESVKKGWKYSLGHVTENILREHIPQPTKCTLALVCGPPPMMQFAVNPNLEKMGYDLKESLLVF